MVRIEAGDSVLDFDIIPNAHHLDAEYTLLFRKRLTRTDVVGAFHLSGASENYINSQLPQQLRDSILSQNGLQIMVYTPRSSSPVTLKRTQGGRSLISRATWDNVLQLNGFKCHDEIDCWASLRSQDLVFSLVIQKVENAGANLAAVEQPADN